MFSNVAQYIKNFLEYRMFSEDLRMTTSLDVNPDCKTEDRVPLYHLEGPIYDDSVTITFQDVQPEHIATSLAFHGGKKGLLFKELSLLGQGRRSILDKAFEISDYSKPVRNPN